MKGNNKSTPDNKKEIGIRKLYDGTNVMIINDCVIKIAHYEMNSYPDGSTELTIHIKGKPPFGEVITVMAESINTGGDETAHISNQIMEQNFREFRESARIQKRSSTISIICVVLQIVITAVFTILCHYC